MPNETKNKKPETTPSPPIIGPATSNTQPFGTYASNKGGSRKLRKHRTRKHKSRRVR
jgi:hypothetical protein